MTAFTTAQTTQLLQRCGCSEHKARPLHRGKCGLLHGRGAIGEGKAYRCVISCPCNLWCCASANSLVSSLICFSALFSQVKLDPSIFRQHNHCRFQTLENHLLGNIGQQSPIYIVQLLHACPLFWVPNAWCEIPQIEFCWCQLCKCAGFYVSRGGGSNIERGARKKTGCHIPKPCSVSCVQASELFKSSMTEQQLKLEEASIWDNLIQWTLTQGTILFYHLVCANINGAWTICSLWSAQRPRTVVLYI